MKRIIAFDFDGVICDGLAEYFHSAWLGYQQLWQPVDSSLAENIRPQFNALRPVIETGWEMIVLIAALIQDIPETRIVQDWQSVIAEVLRDTDISQQQLMQTLDHVRDRQIAENLDQWLRLHRFYDGILDCLRNLLADPDHIVYIITTKEARFTAQILGNQGLDFPTAHIFGKEIQQSKNVTLQQLILKHSTQKIDEVWFIEDRLPTLQKVQQDPLLNRVKLFLADWGYNTIAEQTLAQEQGMTVVSLQTWQQFLDHQKCN